MMVTKRCVGHYQLLDGHYFIQARLSNNVSTGKKTRVHPLQKEKAKCWYSRAKKKEKTRTGLVLFFFVSNATFIGICAISWWSVLLVEEIGGPSENHRPVASH